MKYKELDLKKIRKECQLAFAHYTYPQGKCSCCYGPKDLSARYWEGGKVAREEAIRGKFDYIIQECR